MFNMTDAGYPPFMIPAEDGQPAGGIMLDVVRAILKKREITVETLAVPKNRELRYFESGDLDAHATAREWVPDPDAFAFTDPVLMVRNVIITRRDSVLRFTKIDDLFGMRVIAHLGFVYPPLSTHFASGWITRIDTIDESSMLKMVLSDRGDGAIMNDAVGMWLIRQHHMNGKFTLSDAAVTEFGYRVMFAKKWQPLVVFFDREMKRMRQTGELDVIFHRYGYYPPGNA